MSNDDDLDSMDREQLLRECRALRATVRVHCAAPYREQGTLKTIEIAAAPARREDVSTTPTSSPATEEAVGCLVAGIGLVVIIIGVAIFFFCRQNHPIMAYGGLAVGLIGAVAMLPFIMTPNADEADEKES